MKYTIEESKWGESRINIHRTEIPFPQAELATDLMRHLAIACACPDGEDSSGRQKLRLLTPQEVVARATYAKNGWLLQVPVPETKPKPVV